MRLTKELESVLIVLGAIFVILVIVYLGDFFSGTADWDIINADLIGTWPYVVGIVSGFVIVGLASGPYVLAGAGVTGLCFALLIDYLAGQGVITPASFIRFGGSLETLMVVVLLSSLLMGGAIAVWKDR